MVYDFSIPFPPLEVQQEIVDEIEGYQKVIDGARQVVENYKPVIPIDPDWPLVKLGEVCEVNKTSIDPKNKYGENGFIYVDISSIENGSGVISFDNLILGNEAPGRARRIAEKGDVIISTVRPNLKAFTYLSNLPKNVVFSTGFAVLSPKEAINGKFLFHLMFQDFVQNQMLNRMGKGSYPSINQKDVNELLIPLPPIDQQEKIVTEINEIESTIKANKLLIEYYEAKIAARIQSVWEGSG